MASEEVHVIAILKPVEGQKEVLEETMKGLVGEIEKNEPDCISYQLFSNEADGVLYIVEKYKNAAAFAAHMQAPHVAGALATVAEGVLAGAPVVHTVQRVGGFIRS